MTRTEIARFSVPFTRFLDEEGAAEGPLPGFAADTGLLKSRLAGLWRVRRFDKRAVALQRTGGLGTFASSLGQEAVGVGAAAAMTPEDVLLPSYRDAAAQLWRGVTPLELFLYWRGDERGSDSSIARRDFPVCITVGGQALHAVGAAYAMRLKGEPGCAVSMSGDGSTSKGDFYEALNFAALWRVPALFVINNNQWAISVPRAKQSATETLAQKAIAAGMPGEQVDGNDVIAVEEAVSRALARARAGEGPTLIEALTYRLGDHTTSDDATRYRSPAEVNAAWQKEPIRRLSAHLAAQGAWSKADEEALIARIDAEIEAAVETLRNTLPPGPEAMFDFLHERLPDAVRDQRAACLAEPGDG
jgi:2-oxoisovalerate dehydrogenase E1 component subunit alpha